MYLLKIDSYTKLVSEKPEDDGWLAISSFNEIYNTPELGIKALTCVALVMDYGSIIYHYSDKERPIRAMEMVFEDRNAIVWNSDLIQLACIHYKELQVDPVLEQKRILDDLVKDKLDEINAEQESFKKRGMLKDLNDLNALQKAFEKEHGGKDFFYKSPVRNNYALSRLEIKLTDPKSFYHDREKARKLNEQRERERIAKERADRKEELAGKSDDQPGDGNAEAFTSIKRKPGRPVSGTGKTTGSSTRKTAGKKTGTKKPGRPAKK